LWYEPGTIVALQDHDSPEYRNAFLYEPDKQAREKLKKQGIKKRFARLDSFAPVASKLYELFSQYGVHGGTPASLLHASIGPTPYSCAFANRTADENPTQLMLYAQSMKIICYEVAAIHATFGKRYGATPPEVREGKRTLADLLSPSATPSAEMRCQIESLLSEIAKGE
jgi:hypothetical protein